MCELKEESRMKNTLLYTLLTAVATIAYILISRKVEDTRDFR